MIELANEVSSEVIQFEKDLTFVRNFLDKLPREVSKLYELIGIKDQEKIDLLHHIEFLKLDASKGWGAYSKLHVSLNERREAKDLHEVMSIANDLIKGKISASTLSTAVGDVRKAIKQQEKRTYKPRQLKNLDYGNKDKLSM